jgi:hypothetical protein
MIVQHCFLSIPGTRCESKEKVKWTPPPPGEILVSVDAALFADQNRLATGALFRDHQGQCLAAASEPLQGLTDPEGAEALALHRAMVIAKDRGYAKVIFASDCLSLVQRVNSVAPDRSMVGTVVRDIKDLITSFSSASFHHVRRSLNEVAHTLARICNVSSVGFLSDFAPDCIRKTICIDVM